MPTLRLVDGRAARIMFVCHFTHNFFHDILERHDTRGPAIFVHNERHLQSLVAQLDKKLSKLHCFGHTRCRGHEGRTRHLHISATFVWNSHGATQMNKSADVVGPVTYHRETRLSGSSCEVDDVGRARGVGEGFEADAISHDVYGSELTHTDGTSDETRG